LSGTREEWKEESPNDYPGGLAQLARAPALQAGGRRFDSDILHNKTVDKQFRSFIEVRAGRVLTVFIEAVILYHRK
jgi:hypothetical protein